MITTGILVMDRAASPLLRSDELRQWTKVSNSRNLLCLATEYFLLFVLHFTNVYLIKSGTPWPLLFLFGSFTILMTGCLIHRIGLLGHEASHGLLHSNRKSNDLLSDLLCFYPLWSSTDSYRIKHLGHHLHPNDPDLDPNMAGDKTEELYARFPMPRPEFIWNYYAKFFWPPFVLSNLFDLFRMLSFGKVPTTSKEVSEEVEKPNLKERITRLFKKPTILGMLFLVSYVIMTRILIPTTGFFAVVAGQSFMLMIALAVWEWIPENLFKNDSRKCYTTPKNRALIRLLFYTGLITVLAWARVFSGFHWGNYYLLFWILPLIYVFPYLMLLREIYQHANLGQGQLDNSRIIHADPFTRWVLLGYGNDFHLVHHLYPNIPHYHLRAAHNALMEKSTEYRSSIRETTGTFQAPEGREPLLDSLSRADVK
ncbi:MAG: fatty acid desaturase [Verrucomicrobiales bacterium]|nr:fatty acid desaturase [Verrucomicrobiales bacterium]